MDIITAQSVLQNLSSQKSKEKESIDLALSILSDTFQPNIDALTNAQREADTLRLDSETSHTVITELKAQLEEALKPKDTPDTPADAQTLPV